MTTRSQMLSRLAAASLFSLAALAAAGVSAADDYPNRTVTIIVPFGPGGGTDTVARPAADALSRELGQPFVVENLPGANGVIGSVRAANAEPDGYTLYVGDFSTIVSTPLIDQGVPYSPLESFEPITQFIEASQVFLVHPESPIETFADLIETARADPGGLNYGTSSTSTHLPVVLLALLADIEMTHIPYVGTGPVTNDLLAGHIDVTSGGALGSMPFVHNGQLRALAVTGRDRMQALPEVPTISELGFPDYEVSTWNALFAPAGTPREIIDKINAVVVEALHTEPLKSRLEDGGVRVVGNSPDELRDLMLADYEKWQHIIAEVGPQNLAR